MLATDSGLIHTAIPVNSTFMSLLFQYRQIFHRIAFRALPPGAAVPISICWVDVLLVQLWKVTIYVAGGFTFDMDPYEQLESLRPQLEEDYLRAAAQLPRMSSRCLMFELMVTITDIWQINGSLSRQYLHPKMLLRQRGVLFLL